METHKMLKEICDKIGYGKDFFHLVSGTIIYQLRRDGELINEIELIFTPEFITNLLQYCLLIGKRNIGEIKIELINNTNNPTLYLYNLLELGKN